MFFDFLSMNDSRSRCIDKITIKYSAKGSINIVRQHDILERIRSKNTTVGFKNQNEKPLFKCRSFYHISLHQGEFVDKSALLSKEY